MGHVCITCGHRGHTRCLDPQVLELDSCEPPYRPQKTNPSPLQEPQIFLATEPSLQPLTQLQRNLQLTLVSGIYILDNASWCFSSLRDHADHKTLALSRSLGITHPDIGRPQSCFLSVLIFLPQQLQNCACEHLDCSALDRIHVSVHHRVQDRFLGDVTYGDGRNR